MQNILKKLLAFKPGAVPAVRRGAPSTAFMRGERSEVFADWYPPLRDAKDDVRSAWWRGAARTIDMIHNSGWIAGIVNKGQVAIIGNGLNLALNPDYEALGWTASEANSWARTVERRFELWAKTPIECDASGKCDLHQLARSALRQQFATGEWVVWLKWIQRAESETGTKVAVIPSHRLVQDSSGDDLFQGVRVNPDGLPVSYQFRLATPLTENGAITEIRARDSANRPIILHAFDGDAGQMRGMSVFAPVLSTLRQYDQLSEATLRAALIQTLTPATIESPSPTQDVMAAFETQGEQDHPGVGGNFETMQDLRAGWYEGTTFNLGGLSRVVHLFAGEKLNFMRSETPNSNYEPFVRWLLRECAMCAGFTSEDVTGDYTGATYSSVKMATTTNWPIQLWRRAHWAAPFYRGCFEAWLEEDIQRGLTPFPGGLAGFHANRAAAIRGNWRGPAKPMPDEVKFAAFVESLYSLGVVYAEWICGELGLDYEDVLDALQREKEMREARGLPEPSALGGDLLKTAMAPEPPANNQQNGGK